MACTILQHFNMSTVYMCALPVSVCVCVCLTVELPVWFFNFLRGAGGTCNFELVPSVLLMPAVAS